MFASRITKEIQPPTDPAYTVTIRQLSGRAKARCQEAVITRAASLVERSGGAKAFAAIQDLGGEREVREAVERDPSQSYDQATVLVEGIVSWTAAEDVTPEQIDDLEPETSDLLFREILRLSRVAVTAEDATSDAAARKNG